MPRRRQRALEAHTLQSTREMSAFLTSRDYALRLALWLVVATEALVLALLVLLNGELPSFSWPMVITTAALVGAALSRGHLSRMLTLGMLALVAELVALPSEGKLVMIIASLHAAQVATGTLLVAWTLALPRWRRNHTATLVTTYWYFVAMAWLVVGPVLHSSTPLVAPALDVRACHALKPDVPKTSLTRGIGTALATRV